MVIDCHTHLDDGGVADELLRSMDEAAIDASINSETGTILTYANVETLKTTPIGRILSIAVLSDYLLRPALE